MRTTEIRCAQNIGAWFRFMWVSRGRRRVPDTGAEAVLAAKGIEVVDPNSILTPPYPLRSVPQHLQRLPELEVPHLPPCYVFSQRFSPIAGVEQTQLLTNTILRKTLPEAVLEKATENSPEEDERVQEAILTAHLLHSHQEKLPRVIDVVNKPGYIARREYGIQIWRKNKNLTYQLLLLLDQLNPGAAERSLVEDTVTTITLNFAEGKLIQMDHRAAYISSSPTPLPQHLNSAEVQALKEEPMPDIYPISPLINCRPRQIYKQEDSYGVPTRGLYPHTIFVHNNQPILKFNEETFMGCSLLYAFSHAAAYAKHYCQIDENGDLVKPLVLQVVHNSAKMYSIGVFQLNTINLTGPTKNVLWSEPWMPLFDACSYKAAQPVLQGYNPRVFRLLKGLHCQ